MTAREPTMVRLRRSTFTDTGRPIAPGGFRRALVGVLVGVVVGAVTVVTARRPDD